ncbi:MAG: hypothetical protein WAW88_13950, partial [Nocardioides sp.]
MKLADSSVSVETVSYRTEGGDLLNGGLFERFKQSLVQFLPTGPSIVVRKGRPRLDGLAATVPLGGKGIIDSKSNSPFMNDYFEPPASLEWHNYDMPIEY